MIVLIAGILFSCQTSKINYSWSAKDIVPKKYSKILVLGVLKDNDRELQAKMENHLADDLKQRGYNAFAANQVFPPGTFVPGDTAMYRLRLEGYGGQYEAHKTVFDAMLQSFTIPVVVAKKPDVWNPSTNLYALTTNYFTMKYPENMEDVKTNKGNNDYAMEVRADRFDCSIHADVFGAKNLTVDKVWDQNKSRYHAKETGTTTIQGNKAYWVDYSLRKEISSRAYFVVKNDKVIRVTLNWFAPQKDIYFPVFEKAVTTMTLK